MEKFPSPDFDAKVMISCDLCKYFGDFFRIFAKVSPTAHVKPEGLARLQAGVKPLLSRAF